MNTNNNLQTFRIYLDEKVREEERWRKSLGYTEYPRKKRKIRRFLGKKTFRETGELSPKNDGIYLTYFNRNGQISSEVKWENGSVIGDYKSWYKNGQLSLKVSYKNGVRDGIQKAYYLDGTPKYEDSYKNGWKNGSVKDWFENGQLKKEEHFKDDKRHGISQRYYNNGQIQTEQHFKSGELVKRIEWEENGDLLNGIIKTEHHTFGDFKSVSTYKEGVAVNCITKRYHSGKLSSETNYKYDKRDGIHREWNTLDESKYYHLLSEETYKNGKLNGVCKYYDRYEEKLESLKTFKDGKLINEKNYN